MTLTEVGDWLRANPSPWSALTQEQQEFVKTQLLPTSVGFVDGQRHWFARWWLACTQSDVDAINAVLPDHIRVAPIEVSGSLYLGSDLLTDSMNPGELYYPAQSIVQGLICTYFDTPPAEQA